MKKAILLALVIVLYLSLVACNNDNVENSEEMYIESSIIEQSFFSGRWNSEHAKREGTTAYVRFNSDGRLEWVHVISTNPFYITDKYYGTYEVDGDLVTIALFLTSDISFTGLIQDDGTLISMAGEKFRVNDDVSNNIFHLFD